MAEFVFPSSDYERTRTLAAVTGSWWSDQFGRTDQTESLVEGTARRAVQTYLAMVETFNSVSRLTVPVFHTEQWYPLVLTESDRNGDVAGLPRFNGEFVYNQLSPQIKFDRGVARETSSFPIDSDIVRAPAIFNRILAPSLGYTEGLDYTIDHDNNIITFRDNPFDDSRVPKTEIWQDGEIVDRQTILWLFRGDLDVQNIYLQFGYVLGSPLESSQAYKDLVNAVFDALVEGTTIKSIQLAMAALTGIPIVQEQTETVERIEDDGRYQLVITDQHVYKFEQGSTVTVSVGDTVEAGQTLTDALEFYEFQTGETPANLLSLGYGYGLLVDGFLSGLLFENADKDLVVEENYPPEGKTRVEWEIGGFPGDVERFFELLHERGVADGQTLANLLDVRSNPVGEPTADNLPATINPLEFLIENIFRSNTFLVKVKVAQSGPDALGLGVGSILRKLVPPWTLMVVLAELSAGPDSVTMDGPGGGSETAAGYDEDVAIGIGMEPIAETIDPPTYVSERVIVKQVGGRCI